MSRIRLALLAPPDAPGARALLDRAVELHADTGRALSVLLSGPGIAWVDDGGLASRAREADVDVCLCSQSARDVGVDAATLPDWVRPSSLVVWLRDLDAEGVLWTALP